MVNTWYTIYTTSAFNCPYCVKAKELLQVYGIDYFEKDIHTNETWKQEFKDFGFRMVPQIYREESYIGGCTELEEHLRINHNVRANEEARAEKS